MTALKLTASDSPFICDETINKKKTKEMLSFKPNSLSVFYSPCPQRRPQSYKKRQDYLRKTVFFSQNKIPLFYSS